MRIALVEDNSSLAKGIRYRLEDSGHAVDVLIDGNDAEAFLKTESADLIILDINLPGVDGLTILKGLRKRGDTRPVIYDPTSRQLFDGTTEIDLPRREMSILECLIDAEGRLVSKSALLDHSYGVGADVDEKVVEVYVSRLRSRLSSYGLQIKTRRGLGYVLTVEPS
jgi:two-component system OmpR family response regulator